MFFWQASQEVEENQGRPAKRSLRDLRTDNTAGMFFSQATTWFIITAATVLHTAIAPTLRWVARNPVRALLFLGQTA